MNADTLRTFGEIDSLLRNLEQNNIDIARIQETHKEKQTSKNMTTIIYIMADQRKIKLPKQIKLTITITADEWPLLLKTILLYI